MLRRLPKTLSTSTLRSRPFHIDDSGHQDWKAHEHRTIQIRFSSVPESIVDALHGIRAIERQFGRIREYRLLRDSEIRSEYQAICWAAFESPKSLLRVPQQGTSLKVGLPPRLGRPEGGLGLDDLKVLLAPEDRTKSISQDQSARFMTLSVKRSDTAITFRNTEKPPFRSRAMKAAIGHGFLEWGGFAPLKPLYASSPYSSPTQELAPLDSKHIRLTLNKWSQILNVPDPLFPDMRHPADASETRPKSAESDWEPLSEPVGRLGAEANTAEHQEATRKCLKQSLSSIIAPRDRG